MVRIITGIVKNTQLKTPRIEKFRSVQDIAKGSVFSILDGKTKHSICLDLFAGSGNLGLEALSRGASWCDFVDNHKEAQKTIKENIKKCGFAENSRVYLKDAVKFVANTDKKYDLIFIDPFYDDTSHIFLTKNLAEVLKDKGRLIFFHGKNLAVENLIKDTDLHMMDERRFGQSFFTILNKQ